MASSKTYLDFILEQLSELQDIRYRAMMGEFIIYYRNKIVGGIYDDRLLVKAVPSAIAYMPNASYELPYEGAKEMLLVDEEIVDSVLSDDEEDKKQKINKLRDTVIGLCITNKDKIIRIALKKKLDEFMEGNLIKNSQPAEDEAQTFLENLSKEFTILEKNINTAREVFALSNVISGKTERKLNLRWKLKI